MFSNNVKIYGVKRGRIIHSSIKNTRVQLGFGGSLGIDSEKGVLCLGTEGKIIFDGNARFAEGCKIRVDSGVLHIGSNFSANKNCFISCTKGITIGDNTLFAWNINVRDADGHTMLHNGVKKDNMASIAIGEHVWIAAYVDILKGIKIPDGCVVAYRSCITKTIPEKNSLVAGYPAVAIRSNIDWEI